MTKNSRKQQQIEWCRSEQAKAQEHRAAGHSCDHPQCTPDNNLRWLLDAFGEDILVEFDLDTTS